MRMRGFPILLSLGALGFGLLLLTAGSRSAPATVSNVDLESYLGLWHEIRRIPNNFQDDEPACVNTTAEYGQLEGGRVSVRNTCYRLRAGGRMEAETARAVARIVEGSSNSKLKVNFTGLAVLRWLRIGDGDYWIFALGPRDAEGRYSWALVGGPHLDYGWILSRDPQLAEETVEEILQKAASIGYRTELFRDFRTPPGAR